jgi:hypothetical protein
MISQGATYWIETAHNATVASAEPVIGPAEDTATFFQPRGMVFVTWLWVLAVVWGVCVGLYVLVRLAFGHPPTAADLVTIVEFLLVVPAVGASVCMLAAWSRLGWLHSSVHGLEFAATGRKAVRMPWPAVASVALRHRGVFTELVVTPSALDAVEVQPGRGRRPRTTGDSYVVDVGLMSPGPEVLLAELHRRIPSKV